MSRLVVSSAPFVRKGNDINKMFLLVAISLLIPAIYGIMFFGVNALMIIAVSVITCFLTELSFNLLTGKSYFVNDFSFFITGITLALVLPYTTPFYVVMAAAFVSIFVGKMAFGGLGKNKFNPSLVGRCLAGVIYPSISVEAYRFVIEGQVYKSLAEGGTNTLLNLVMGKAVGGLGSTCIVIIIVVAVFLVYNEVIDYKIPLISIITYFVTSLMFCGVEQAAMGLCSGSFVFVAEFMMTDPNSSPNTFLGKMLYSVLFGVFSSILWHNSIFGENAVFVVALCVNALVPFMDKYLSIKLFKVGGFRNAYKN